MKKIQSYLTRVLALEMEKVYLVEAENIPHDEIAESMDKLCQIKDLQYSGESFDLSTVLALGIDNCCNFFKTVCLEYGNYKSGDLKKRGTLTLSVANNEHVTDISDYNVPKKIDETIEANFAILKKRDKGISTDEELYEKVMVNTFAGFYYGIRDVLEGVSYGDKYNASRELPDYYIYSQDDLDEMASKKGISRDKLKKELLENLDQGIEVITKVIYSREYNQKPKVMRKK